MFNMNDVDKVIDHFNLSLDGYTKEDILEGLNVELEHGLINPLTNVTNDDLISTAKIALAHLLEFPNYYNKEYGIRNFENMLSEKLNNV